MATCLFANFRGHRGNTGERTTVSFTNHGRRHVRQVCLVVLITQQKSPRSQPSNGEALTHMILHRKPARCADHNGRPDHIGVHEPGLAVFVAVGDHKLAFTDTGTFHQVRVVDAALVSYGHCGCGHQLGVGLHQIHARACLRTRWLARGTQC